MNKRIRLTLWALALTALLMLLPVTFGYAAASGAETVTDAPSAIQVAEHID